MMELKIAETGYHESHGYYGWPKYSPFWKVDRIREG